MYKILEIKDNKLKVVSKMTRGEEQLKELRNMNYQKIKDLLADRAGLVKSEENEYIGTDDRWNLFDKYLTRYNCDHLCSGECRRSGCNCDCGEWHDPIPKEWLTDYSKESLEDDLTNRPTQKYE